MTDPRPEKVAVVAEVKEKFEASNAAVLTEYRGLNVTDMAELRRSVREGDGEYKVYKNTLVRLAVADLEVDLTEYLTGPTAIAFVPNKDDGSRGDPVGVAKALTAFAKAHPELVIKGGILAGGPLSAEQVEQLSKVASREELLTKLAGGLAAPMMNFANLLKALPQNFAYALSALVAAGGAPGAPADAPPSTDDEATTQAPPPEAPVDEAQVDDAPVDDAPADDADADTAPASDEAPGAQAAAADDASEPATSEPEAVANPVPAADADSNDTAPADTAPADTDSTDSDPTDTDPTDSDLTETEDRTTPEEG